MSTVKETLQQSLLELSKSQTVHYEVTANEISNTRLALLKMDGVNIEEMCNQEVAFKAWNKLNQEVKKLEERKSNLTVQLMKLNEEILTKTAAKPKKLLG